MPSPQEILDQLKPTSLEGPRTEPSPEVRAALPHLYAAMKAMDALYLRQLGDGVSELAARFAEDDASPEAEAFRIMNGPWNGLAGDAPFLEGVAPPSPGRGLYPKDLDAEALDAWIAAHPEDREALLDPYTVVRREGERLVAVPYHEAFADALAEVAAELEAAADALGDLPLAAFLRGRAAALTGKKPLRESDADWVRLDRPPLEVVIGPFEVYQDRLRGVKAFYEGMLLVVDQAACDALDSIAQALPELAKVIPTPAGSRPSMGGMAPMVVADELLATGDGYSGILASAFNLPNDPWVRGEVGWKQVMIRNVMNAKFETCTAPIAGRVLSAAQLEDLSFDAYFHFVLLHEVSHGLGPAYRADGRSTNEACGTAYTPLEEAKADIGSLVLLLSKSGAHGLPALTTLQVGTSYLAGLYRSARFGVHEAHGKANVIEYTFLREFGALVPSEDGRLRVEPDRLLDGAKALLDRLTTLQAAGTAEELSAFLEKYGTVPRELEEALEGLSDLPVDIRPEWPTV